MNAVAALILDSLRELRARKLFWIALAISAMIVIGYGSIGVNSEGFTILYGLQSFPSEQIRAGTPWARILFEGIFSVFIVNIWLAWGAVILALCSTASVFPDLLAGGSIDLIVSKPIRRISIFATKYFGSLLFVFIQVAVFCIGVFLVIGLRVGAWRWSLFLAIPVVVAMFSYLYGIMVLLNIITRSALASLIITMLAWVSLSSIQTTEGALNFFRTDAEQNLVVPSRALQARDQRLAEYLAMSGELETRRQAGLSETEFQRLHDKNEADIRRWRDLAEKSRAEVDQYTRAINLVTPWHTRVRTALAVLPKNKETIGLVQRWLESDSDLSFNDLMRGDFGQLPDPATEPFDPEADSDSRRALHDSDLETQEALEADYKSRSVLFIIGTSLGFEAVLVCIAAFLFVRRDF